MQSIKWIWMMGDNLQVCLMQPSIEILGSNQHILVRGIYNFPNILVSKMSNGKLTKQPEILLMENCTYGDYDVHHPIAIVVNKIPEKINLRIRIRKKSINPFEIHMTNHESIIYAPVVDNFYTQYNNYPSIEKRWWEI